jgi:hypothetical protein
VRRKFKGDGYAVATLLYGPPKVDPDGQTSLPLDNPEPPEEEPQADDLEE